MKYEKNHKAPKIGLRWEAYILPNNMKANKRKIPEFEINSIISN